MLQLARRMRDGKVFLLDVPQPQLSDNEILVKNHYSAISIGTEKSTQTLAKKNLLSKAFDRKDDVLKVINVIKKNGIKKPFN